jgi:hypothetical protein
MFSIDRITWMLLLTSLRSHRTPKVGSCPIAFALKYDLEPTSDISRSLDDVIGLNSVCV